MSIPESGKTVKLNLDLWQRAKVASVYLGESFRGFVEKAVERRLAGLTEGVATGGRRKVVEVAWPGDGVDVAPAAPAGEATWVDVVFIPERVAASTSGVSFGPSQSGAETVAAPTSPAGGSDVPSAVLPETSTVEPEKIAIGFPPHEVVFREPLPSTKAIGEPVWVCQNDRGAMELVNPDDGSVMPMVVRSLASASVEGEPSSASVPTHADLGVASPDRSGTDEVPRVPLEPTTDDATEARSSSSGESHEGGNSPADHETSETAAPPSDRALPVKGDGDLF